MHWNTHTSKNSPCQAWSKLFSIKLLSCIVPFNLQTSLRPNGLILPEMNSAKKLNLEVKKLCESSRTWSVELGVHWWLRREAIASFERRIINHALITHLIIPFNPHVECTWHFDNRQSPEAWNRTSSPKIWLIQFLKQFRRNCLPLLAKITPIPCFPGYVDGIEWELTRIIFQKGQNFFFSPLALREILNFLCSSNRRKLEPWRLFFFRVLSRRTEANSGAGEIYHNTTFRKWDSRVLIWDRTEGIAALIQFRMADKEDSENQQIWNGRYVRIFPFRYYSLSC